MASKSSKSALKTRPKTKGGKSRRGWSRRLLLLAAVLVVCFYTAILVSLVLLRWVNPFTTSVQIEMRVTSWFSEQPYQKRYSFVSLDRISPAFQHAVVSAEDARFFQHYGFDWRQVQRAAAEDVEGKRMRGASTIDQQLVKNLFLTTSRSFLRKGIEASIVPFGEVILGKRRILELYLNVVEWGPGVYGAEAAANYWYHIPASRITREQGARLAALLPAPRRRRPEAVNSYSAVILSRMRQVGW